MSFISPGLAVVFIFYTAGIYLGKIYSLPGQPLLPFALLLLGPLFLFYKANLKLSSVFSCFHLILLFFLLGLLQYPRLQLNPPAASDHIYNLIKNRQTVTIEGILQKYPPVINFSTDPQTRLLIKAEKILKAAENSSRPEFFNASGLILLTLKGLLPEYLKPGDRLLVKADLSRIYTYSTPGSFDYRKYLANQSIFIKGWVQLPQNIIKLQTPEKPFAASIFTNLFYLPERIRNSMAAFLNTTLDQPERGLYKAILIGDRSDVPNSVIDNFTKAGCLHILAISGMHMGLLAFMTISGIYWILKRSTWLLLNVPVLKVSVALSFLPLSFYALIAGLNIPVLRALLMTSVFIMAILFDRPENLLNHILIAAFIVLILKPWALFSTSFQLSFSAVTAIALIYPILQKFFLRKFDTISRFSANVHAIDEKSSPYLFNNIICFSLKWLSTGFALTMAAMLGTLPLLLYHFNRFSLVAPASNLLVEPLICFWSLPLGLAAGLSIAFFPALAKILFIVGGFGLAASERICALFSGFSYSSIWTATPAISEIITAYFFLLCMIMAFQLSKKPKLFALILAFCCISFLILVTEIAAISEKNNKMASVTFIDVGHGSSILLQFTDGKNILIDGGGAVGSRFNIGERVIGPFLWHRKIRRLDAVVVTHPHADHYNGLPFILKRFRPARLWINGIPGEDKEYQELLYLADKLGIAIEIAQSGDILYQTEAARLTCIHSGKSSQNPAASPNQKLFLNPNDLSIVLYLEINSKVFLLPADISASTAEMLNFKGKELKADVLMAPHHGSASSVSPGFIRAVAPEYIAISAGRSSRFNLPDKSLYDLEQKGIKILSTNRDGTITFTVENKENNTLKVSRYQVN